MGNFKIEWLDRLEAALGRCSSVHKIRAGRGPEIVVFYFSDAPQKGLLTAVTCGLSDADPDHATTDRHEVAVTMASSDKGWGMGAAWLASQHFGEKSFCVGNVLQLDEPIVKTSEMSAYLSFLPSCLEGKDATFDLSDRTVHLVGLYPIFEKEIATYQEVGIESFWKHKDFDTSDPERGPVG